LTTNQYLKTSNLFQALLHRLLKLEEVNTAEIQLWMVQTNIWSKQIFCSLPIVKFQLF